MSLFRFSGLAEISIQIDQCWLDGVLGFPVELVLPTFVVAAIGKCNKSGKMPVKELF
jgi:hypothetical protein